MPFLFTKGQKAGAQASQGQTSSVQATHGEDIAVSLRKEAVKAQPISPANNPGSQIGIMSLGTATEIVGFVGGGIGLATALFFSSHITEIAVVAEMSVDIGLIAVGAIMRKYASGISERIGRIFKGRNKPEGSDIKCRSPLHTIGKVALITSPLELAIGFGITGFSSTLSETAVLVTALPCMVFAAAGLLHSKFSKSDRKAQTKTTS